MQTAGITRIKMPEIRKGSLAAVVHDFLSKATLGWPLNS